MLEVWNVLNVVVQQRATMYEITTTMTLDEADLLNRALRAWNKAIAEARNA